MLLQYNGWKMERLNGSKMGRRGSATKRYGWILTAPDGCIWKFPPNADGSVSRKSMEEFIDMRILHDKLVAQGKEDA